MSMLLDDASDTTAFVAGVGRSGTTWLMEILNYRRDTRLMFEPFWDAKVPECSMFTPYQFLPPGGVHPQHLLAAQAVMSGRLRNPWVDRYNPSGSFSKRVVKDIRSNLYLEWLRINFPKVPIILLIRHPCAVVSSQLLSGFPEMLAETAKGFVQDEDLMPRFLHKYVDLIVGVKTTFEDRIMAWCIRNMVPLRQCKRGSILVMFYESLLISPESELRRLSAFLGQDYDPGVMLQWRTASRMAKEHSTVRNGRDPLTFWLSVLNDREVERAREIVGMFGLDGLYGSDGLPAMDADIVLEPKMATV